MDCLRTAIKRLVVADDGQDLVEYGLLAALIAVVVITGVTSVGTTIHTVFWQVIGHAV